MRIKFSLLTITFISSLMISMINIPTTTASEANSWPSGPSVNSTAAILMDAETGTILYEKNINDQMYPASITKLLTALIAYESSDLTEMVSFSEEAIATIPSDSSRIWVDPGEALSMEDSIASILIASANDVSAGVAEHIAGSLDGFATLMNERAVELGCLNSNFTNAHGYHDDNHYTTAYDMALIAREFFSHELLAKYSSERILHILPSDTQPDEIWENSKNSLLETREYAYEYLVGSKTGYTSAANQTLISAAQKDGMTLICVVLSAESPYQFEDTVSLFDYGFNNYKIEPVSEDNIDYLPNSYSFSTIGMDIFGDSTPLLSVNSDSFVVLPKDADIEDIQSEIILEDSTSLVDSSTVATVSFHYEGRVVGTTPISITSTVTPSTTETEGVLNTAPTITEEPALEDESTVIQVNIYMVILILAIVIALPLLFLYLYRFTNLFRGIQRRRSLRRRKKYQLKRMSEKPNYKRRRPSSRRSSSSRDSRNSRSSRDSRNSRESRSSRNRPQRRVYSD